MPGLTPVERQVMETTDDLVREIAAREAIRNLSAQYCDCIWRKDVDGLVSLFTEDGAFRVEGLKVEASSHGRAQLRKIPTGASRSWTLACSSTVSSSIYLA